jgi:hypothetical protein
MLPNQGYGTCQVNHIFLFYICELAVMKVSFWKPFFYNFTTAEMAALKSLETVHPLMFFGIV